jgi:hypothetical protein
VGLRSTAHNNCAGNEGTCGCRGSGPTVRIGRELHTSLSGVRRQNREGHSPLAIHTAAFVHVLVELAAGFALCFGESINLT